MHLYMHNGGMLNKSKELNNMTIRIERTGGFELQASECPKCKRPTLDQTRIAKIVMLVAIGLITILVRAI